MKTRRPGGASTSPSSHKLLDWCLSGDETRNHRAPHVCTVFVKLSLRLSFPSLFSQRINPRRMYNQCNRVRCPGGGERHARLLWPCRPRLPFGAELRPLWCPAWQGRRPRRDHRLLLVVSVGVGVARHQFIHSERHFFIFSATLVSALLRVTTFASAVAYGYL